MRPASYLWQQARHGQVDLQEVPRVAKSVAEQRLPVLRPTNSEARVLDSVFVPAYSCPDRGDDRLLQRFAVAVLLRRLGDDAKVCLCQSDSGALPCPVQRAGKKLHGNTSTCCQTTEAHGVTFQGAKRTLNVVPSLERHSESWDAQQQGDIFHESHDAASTGSCIFCRTIESNVGIVPNLMAIRITRRARYALAQTLRNTPCAQSPQASGPIYDCFTSKFGGQGM